MKNNEHTYIIEGKATENDPCFEPSELMAIAFGGAANFLAEHPDVSEEKKAALKKMIAEERAEKEEALKTVVRRYKVALNQAKIFQARNQSDDFSIVLDRTDPTVEQPGFVRLRAEYLHTKDEKFLKAIAGASYVDMKTVEVEVENGFVFETELTLWFKV